jgi:hypothetical protein
LKEHIRSAQVRVALAVSHELLTLYWNVGVNSLPSRCTAAGELK